MLFENYARLGLSRNENSQIKRYSYFEYSQEHGFPYVALNTTWFPGLMFVQLLSSGMWYPRIGRKMEAASYSEAVCTRQHGFISQKRVHSTIYHETICNLNIHSHENISSHALFFYVSCHNWICHKRLLHAEQSLIITALKLYRVQPKKWHFLNKPSSNKNSSFIWWYALTKLVHFKLFYILFYFVKMIF